VGSVGVTPKLKKAIFDRLESGYGLKLPTVAGRDTMACMDGAMQGELELGFCLGGNLYGSNPDSGAASRALSNLDFLVYVSTSLNTGHAWGLAKETIILPALARDEEPQATTQESMFNYVRMSDGGPARVEGPRSEIDIVASIAERVLDDSPIDWTELRASGNIRRMIADVVPGYEAIGEMDETKKEFQIAGRTFHAPRFSTADGKARLHVHELDPAVSLGESELRLMTIRSEGQFNTVVYEENDQYRGVNRRDVVLIHPKDLSRMGLADGDRVDVAGPGGTMRGLVATAFPLIRDGSAAMYYPEANRILDRRVDDASRTPAFKGARITIVRSPSMQAAGKEAPLEAFATAT
jgi:anaerobic selenocysteine-containing dehydrogenase